MAMFENIGTILPELISFIVGGGLGSLITLSAKRRQEENLATQGVQDIYQEMIEDIKNDRDYYKKQCDDFRNDIAMLNRKVAVLESELREYRRQTDGTPPTRRRRTTAPKPVTAGKEKKEHPS